MSGPTERLNPDDLIAIAVELEEQCKRTQPGQILHREIWRVAIRSLKDVAAHEEFLISLAEARS